MALEGVNVQVHVPAPHVALAPKSHTDATSKKIRRPFEILAKHFENDSLQLGSCNGPITIKTINLNKPKTEIAHRVLSEI